jgi:hypothetical protein
MVRGSFADSAALYRTKAKSSVPAKSGGVVSFTGGRHAVVGDDAERMIVDVRTA